MNSQQPVRGDAQFSNTSDLRGPTDSDWQHSYYDDV